MSNKSSVKHSWKILSITFCLLVLLTAGAAPAERVSQSPVLIRLDAPSLESLAALAEQGLNVYGEIYTADGRVILLLPAAPDEQARLIEQGYTLQTLDSQARNAEYFLVKGETEELQRVAAITPLLMVEGRQAVVRSTAAKAETFSALGVRWQPLRLHALIIDSQPKAPLEATTITPSLLVQQMLTQISQTDLYNHVGSLSGEWPVTIEGSPYTIATRYTWEATAIQKATRYTHDYFQSLGLATDYDYYYINGSERRNVLAQQVGVNQPNNIYMITAHMDSTSNSPYSLAPGADDNASGSVAVMRIAEILRNYQFDCTIRYALFTGEEQGLYGSYYYAQEVSNPRQNILGVLNLDMVAFNTIGSARTLELHTRPSNGQDLAIANLFKDAVTAYQINLTPYILQDGEEYSDHASFWEFGFTAILAIEDWTDHTPHYHKTTDRLSTLDMSYYTDFTRAALATFAHMGCLREGKLSGRVTNLTTGQPVSGALVRAELDASHNWQTTTKTDGTYLFGLTPGTYTVSASATGYERQTAGNIAVNNAQTTSKDFALRACANFSNPNFTYNPIEAEVGQAVSFNASVSGFSTPVFSWDFGDGGSGSGQSTSHVFNAPGGYSVTLTVTNACAPTSITKIVLVQEFFHWFAPLILR